MAVYRREDGTQIIAGTAWPGKQPAKFVGPFKIADSYYVATDDGLYATEKNDEEWLLDASWMLPPGSHVIGGEWLMDEPDSLRLTFRIPLKDKG